MPLETLKFSLKTVADELGFDADRFVGVQVNKQSKTVWILLEPKTDGADKRHVPANER